jgi:hypothetical protein
LSDAGSRPPEPGAPDPSLRRGIVLAAAGGLGSFAALAAACVALAAGGYAATRLFRLWSWVKFGLLNALTSFGVRLDGTIVDPFGRETGHERLAFTLLLLTFGIVWMLFRSGRRAAAGVDGVLRRAVVGASVAPPLAVVTFAVSFLVPLRFPDHGFDPVRPVAWQSFAYPLIVAGVVGAVGGLASTSEGGDGVWLPRARSIVAGGWTSLVMALVLGFGAFLVLAATEPSASSGYVRGVSRLDGGGAMLVSLHVLLLPNQGLDLLAPSMGACTSLRPTQPGYPWEAVARLCPSGLRVEDPLGDGTRSPLPRASAIFWLGAALACVAGGRRAAAGVRGREAAVRAVGAGAAFAWFVAAGSWLCSLTLVVPLLPGVFRLSPEQPMTTVLALIWGVGGGLVGALLATLESNRAQEMGRAGPELPSPTSLK